MGKRALNGDMVKALRAGLGRPAQQRAKLEKVQKLRRALDELSLASRRRPAKACEPT